MSLVRWTDEDLDDALMVCHYEAILSALRQVREWRRKGGLTDAFLADQQAIFKQLSKTRTTRMRPQLRGKVASTYREIAEDLGVTKERVWQMVCRYNRELLQEAYHVVCSIVDRDNAAGVDDYGIIDNILAELAKRAGIQARTEGQNAN